MELAELAIRIDSRDAKNAEADLKRLADTGTHTERSLEGVGEGGKEAARGSDAAARSSREAAAAMDRHAEAARRVTSAVRYFAAASVAAGAAAATWMLSMSRSMDATQKMAEQIGVTTEALTGMRFAAQQFANISDQTFDMSMRRMTRRIEEAAQGGGAAKAAIEGLGFSAKELARLSPDRQMLAIADAMQRTESQARRLQYAMAIFDTEGMPLVAALQQGSAAFEENIRLAQRYGVVLSTEAAQAATDFQTEVSRLHAIVSGFSLDIANQVLPTLNRFINNAIEAATKVDGLHSEVKELTRDSAFNDWFNASLVGLARVADVAVAVAKSIGVVGLAFKAAAADVQAGLAWLAKPNAADKLLMPAEEYQRLVDEYDAAMSHQKNTVERFNAALDNLLNYQGNRFEQAAIRAINTITVTSDKITTVDLTVGGDSAGASEEQLKKLAEWTERLATPTEKLEMTLARAKAELGSLYTPEIERRIRAQYAAQQSGNKVLTEAQRIQQAFERERQQSLRTQRAAISAIHEEARGIEDQVALYGLSRTAIEDLTIARLEEQAALLSGRAGAEEQLEIFEREIEARKRLRTAIGSMEQKEAEKQAWEAWARDVEQIFNRVGQSLTDAIFDGGKSGKDLLRDLFKGLTFNILINPVMKSLQGWVTNQLGGLFGVQNPQQQTGGGGFGFGGGGAFGAGGVQMAGDWLLRSGLAPETGANMLMNADSIANIGSSILGYGKAIFDLAEGRYGSAAGTAIGTYIMPGPGTVVGSMIGSLVDGLGNAPETRYGGGFHYQPGDTTAAYFGGPSGRDAGAENVIASMITDTAQSLQSIFDAIGSDVLVGVHGSAESSGKGRGGTASGGDLYIDGEIIASFGTIGKGTGFGGTSGSLEEMIQNLGVDLTHTFLEGLQAGAAFLPSTIQGMLDGIVPSDLNAEQAVAVAQHIQLVIEQVGAFQLAVESLPFATLRDLSFDAAANLISFAGGLENLDAGMTSYFQNFYSEAEQLDWATQQIGAAFDELGLTMPDVTQGAEDAKAAYRELVESLDVATEEGQRAYATLMTLSGGFHELVTGMEGLSPAVEEVVEVIDHLGIAIEALTRRAADAERALQLSLSGGQLADRLGGMLGLGPVFAMRREQELWATIGQGSYEQQLSMSQELSDLVLARIDAEQQANQQRLTVIREELTTYRRMRDLGASLQTYLQSLESSNLAPYSLAEKVSNAEADLNRLVASARGGDETAMRQVQSALQNALTLWREYGASGNEYAMAYQRLTGSVGDLATVSLSDAERQIAQLESQSSALEGIAGYSADQLSQLQYLYDLTAAATDAAYEQYQRELDIAKTELDQLERLGLDTARLHDIADLLQSLPASIAVQMGAGGGYGYLASNPDVMAAYGEHGGDASAFALGHYYDYGQLEGRSYSASREEKYLLNNPDVMAAFLQDAAGMSAAEFARRHYEQYGKYEGRSYRSGTPYVPYDMLANIHKGEIVIDPRSSDILRNYGIQVQGGGNGEVVRLLQNIERRLDSMQEQGQTLTREQITAVVAATREAADKVVGGVGEAVERRGRDDLNRRNSTRRGLTV